MSLLTTAAWALAAGAGVVHLYIFALEALWIDGPTARTVFGLTPEDVEIVRPWAFNQGFYNLFLAVQAFGAVALALTGSGTAARPLCYFACGSMVAAAAVLVLSDRTKLAAALKQGIVPAGAMVLLAVG